MKGIILAGGKGSRLLPLTSAISKQLLPVYNKPMIYYPLSMLMMAEIRDILIISTPESLPLYKQLLRDGSQWNINISYAVQKKSNGLAEAFIIGEEFIGDSNVCLVLGDNIFYGTSLRDTLLEAKNKEKGAVIFAYRVKNPHEYGVVDFNQEKIAVSIEEKPQNPRSDYAIPGIYFYGNDVIQLAKNLEPSERGELEITDINRIYLQRGELQVIDLGRGVAWLDAGTHEALLQAANFIYTIEERQGKLISSPDEIAYYKLWISAEQLRDNANAYHPSDYSNKLLALLE